jgi:IPT/TIG domain
LPSRDRALPSHDREGVLFDLCIAAALFVGNLLLLGPWLTTDLSDQPWNNGYIYTAIARMFRDRSSMWNALQYGGSPFHFLYPPIFPTLAALPRFLPIGRAFHLVSGIGYALAPVCLYLLGRQLFRSRLPAVFAALAYAVFPSLVYGLPQVRVLAHPYAYAPWSFVALVGYDEAPHAFALPFMLLAVAAAWRNRWTLASVLAGAVFLTSWPGLIGLGFPLVGLAVARWRDFGALRALACVAGLTGTAYGLAAFWMTPAYFASSRIYNRVVFRHSMLTAPWNRTTWMILAAALLVLVFSFWQRVPSELALVAVWTALSGLVVVSYLVAGNYLLPLPHRYLLELSAGLALLLATLLSLAPPPSRAIVAAVLIATGAALSFRFVTHSWKFEPKPQDPHTQVGYQVAMWLKDHAGGARVLASGELDSTLNLWTDVAQVGGPGQDPSNFLVFAAERQIAFGCDADSGRVAELWLRALNAPLLVVHGAASREYFHWYARPNRFASLPVAWDNGAGDRVYRLPNFDAREAVVVDLAELARLPQIASTADEEFLSAYVKWAAGKRPVAVHWTSSGAAAFNVSLGADEAVLLKVNNDPGWRAAGASVRSDPIGFQLIEVSPGTRHVTLRFGPPWDTWLGRAITLVTIMLLLLRVKEIWIAALAVIPAVAVAAFLIAMMPRSDHLAEEAFARLQPPMINLGGIVDNATSQQPPLKRGQQVSIYGTNFGGRAGDVVRVWIGDRPAPLEFHGSNLIDLRWPDDAPPSAPVSVEVNGCIGNAFTVATR